MLLGIDEISLLSYEGLSTSIGRPIDPSPFLSQASFSHADQPPAQKLVDSPYPKDWKFVFREDTFDPVSRVRRGRFYKVHPSYPESWRVGPHPRIEADRGLVARDGQIAKQLIGFDPLFISDDFANFRTRPVTVALGSRAHPTLWRIVEFERISTGDELVTLRAASTLGALPDLHTEKLPDADRQKILERFNLLASEIHRSSADSIIDHCRDLASATLFGRLRQVNPELKAMDLGDLIKQFTSKDELKALDNVICSAKIINRLHPRRKPSEHERRGIRPLRTQDADFAVLAVSTILCDLEWASWI